MTAYGHGTRYSPAYTSAPLGSTPSGIHMGRRVAAADELNLICGLHAASAASLRSNKLTGDKGFRCRDATPS